MTPIRLAASILGLVSGLWAAYIAFVFVTTPIPLSCPVTGCPAPANLSSARVQAADGGLVAVVSVISLTERRLAFMINAILSATILVTLGLTWGTYSANGTDIAFGLSGLALVVNAVASRPAKELAERDSPLNLPVFG